MADDEEQLRESLKNHPHLTLEELREFKELFNLVDEDKGGSISPQELGSLMETLGLKPNQEELDAMIREIDEDGNGEIDFDEFVQVMSRKVQPTYTPEEVKGAFKVFETPNAGLPPGHVKTAALERALTTSPPLPPSPSCFAPGPFLVLLPVLHVVSCITYTKDF